MATPILDKMSVVGLGKVISETIGIDTNIFTKPIPTSSTDKTVQGNILGKVRTINVDGIFIGTEVLIKGFIDTMELWLNDSGFLKFQTTANYTDSFGNSYVVLAGRFRWVRTNASIGRIVYTLELKEGRTISNIVLGDAT